MEGLILVGKKKKNRFLGIMLSVAITLSISLPMVADASSNDNFQDITGYQLVDGVTEPIYSYADAIKETIYVESELDSDRDGRADRIAVDIIRPEETEDGLKVPVIMDASPYYEKLGRGNESQIKDPDGDGVNDLFPLYYDNYFVPRGYAVVLPDMVGTNNSDGCPTTGGFEEIESVEVVIDWLNGKGEARDKDGEIVEAEWSTGKVGMIGKSYDGTLANGVAASGIEGLETIVPIGAISSWYDYYRYGGIPFYRNGPSGLSKTVTSSSHIDACAPVRDKIQHEADDKTGNYNEFWEERDFIKGADKVHASVFMIHGLNDYNVKTNNFSNWWDALAENDVPRKLWLAQTGHVDPFDFRREEWVDTLHRWFDYWLMGIDNGIMDEPMVDIEREADEWETHSNWPDNDSENVTLRLAPADDELPGTFLTSPLLEDVTQTYTDDAGQTEIQMVEDEYTQKENRLMFLSPELDKDVRLSGIPEVNIDAVVDTDDTNLTAMIVDYGKDERVDHNNQGEGIRTLDEKTCWGEESEEDSPCYKETEKTTHVAPYEIVTHGWLDAQHWQSLDVSEPLETGKEYTFQWDTLPEDYVFKKGHRLGVVIAGSDYQRLIADTNQTNVDVTLGESYVKLPIVGGKQALDTAFGFNGGTSPEQIADVHDVVEYFAAEDDFADNSVLKSLQMHLTAVERFENKQAGEKVVKHMKGFKQLINHQLKNDLISNEAYLVLKADANYIIDKWK
ncbi:Xaa-Pro dipeptidyl-peptidase [Lentibacillus daqui]|uniref:Xaa-Pro dipeptidyl-peptidase n=1 Tax=Lentibacillus daqui TaxID=2911514 RepID=UPI0022B0F5B2|nr:Xaa-Pro dipeptidyl-peptidase [Lentibacillus daqui]